VRANQATRMCDLGPHLAKMLPDDRSDARNDRVNKLGISGRD
jgi:hypothetical protein